MVLILPNSLKLILLMKVFQRKHKGNTKIYKNSLMLYSYTKQLMTKYKNRYHQRFIKTQIQFDNVMFLVLH